MTLDYDAPGEARQGACTTVPNELDLPSGSMRTLAQKTWRKLEENLPPYG